MSLKQRLGLAAEPVFLMDGSAFIYRGFFANRNMQRSDGFPTNSLVVVSRVLLRILREERPRYFAFVQDGTIDVIATDHAPHTAEEKSRGLAGSAMGVVV